MSIGHCAQVALKHWSGEDAITMVAIAGAESSWREDAAGDPISYFHSIGQYQYDPYACGGYLSFGYWQIFQGVHYEALRSFTGSNDPCVWAAWLKNGAQNAQIAYNIWRGRLSVGLNPFTPWSTYNNGAYLQFMDEARAAVEGAPAPAPIPPGEVPGCRSALLTLPWLALRGVKLALFRGVKGGRQYDPTPQRKRRDKP